MALVLKSTWPSKASKLRLNGLQKELKRVTEERDILKKARGVLRQSPRVRYAFIRDYSRLWPTRWLCDLLEVHPSGYYTWCKRPKSRRQKADERLTGLIKQFWLESGGVYGYRKIHEDLREYGERCGQNRVCRLMRLAGLKAQVGYRKPRQSGGKANVIVPNRLQRQFTTMTPDEVWVTDITHIKTHEGWLYLACRG
jgi:putative transposase